MPSTMDGIMLFPQTPADPSPRQTPKSSQSTNVTAALIEMLQGHVPLAVGLQQQPTQEAGVRVACANNAINWHHTSKALGATHHVEQHLQVCKSVF